MTAINLQEKYARTRDIPLFPETGRTYHEYDPKPERRVFEIQPSVVCPHTCYGCVDVRKKMIE